MGTQPIPTRRLLLRPFRTEDAHDMFANWANDPEVTRFLTWPPHPDEKVTLAVLTDWIAHYPEDHYYNWAIEWEKTGHVIGDISVVHQNEDIREAEIGYCLGRAFWGQGIMPEALRAVIDFLFASEGFERIIARHDRNNPKSGRVMRKAGMLQEGIRRRAGLNNQGIVDEVCYAILKSDFLPKVEKPALPPLRVRLAHDNDLEEVNRLRRQVNELHVSGEPAIFKPGFPAELRDYIHTIHQDPGQEIVVAEAEGTLCGYAVLNHIVRPETPFMYTRDFLDIDEFGVDRAFRRRGVGTAMIRFIREYARENGYQRVELNMWEFNRDALAFYETSGFTTYRRYMELSRED